MITLVGLDKEGRPGTSRFESEEEAREKLERRLFEFEPLFGLGAMNLAKLRLHELVDLNNSVFRMDFRDHNPGLADHIQASRAEALERFLLEGARILPVGNGRWAHFWSESVQVSMDLPLIRAVFRELSSARSASGTTDFMVSAGSIMGKDHAYPLVKDRSGRQMSGWSVWIGYENDELEMLVREREGHGHYYCDRESMVGVLFGLCESEKETWEWRQCCCERP